MARLASTGRLAVACALELRELLSRASAGLAAAPGSQASAQLRDVFDSASEITRRLLTAAQRPPTTEIIDLGDLVEDMRRLLGILAGSHAVVVIVRGITHVRVVANRGDLEQILVNLIDAPCAAPAGPRRLTITSGVVEAPAAAHGVRQPAAPQALLSVIDDLRSHAASPAPTCGRCGAVPALGVPLVRAIADAHRGRLVVAPASGGDIEYRVLLPLAPS